MKDKVSYIRWAFSKVSSPTGRRKLLSHPLLLWDFVRKLFLEELLDGKKNLRSSLADYRGTVSALVALSEKLAAVPVPVIPLDDAYVDPSEATNCKALAELFSLHGSDKATTHNYYLLYSSVLKGKRNLPIRILEIGIGTNNVDVPSTMGRLGTPGASLRAFRDWAPNSLVVGADVDQRILFSEDRILTYHVDQLDVDSLEALANRFERHSFDLIIDDGLHTSFANLNTLQFALELIKPDGAFVVEDITEHHLDAWKVALPILASKYSCLLFKERTEYCCLIRNRKPA